MNFNQVTLPARDYAASVAFYRRLGLGQIVDAPPRYARFEAAGGATLSIHLSEAEPAPSGVVVYLETDTLDETVRRLQAAGLVFTSGPQDQPWLWREARLRDPAGNEICLYHAGENRRFPPWRVEGALQPPPMNFVLDPRLAAASVSVVALALCEVRLQDDARWPWLVLIPRRPGLVEIDGLPLTDRRLLVDEAVAAGQAVRAIGLALGRPVEKLNTGALGNIVAQLHVHAVGRRGDDPAWPGPVWGSGRPEPYQPGELETARAAAAAALL